MRYWAELLQPIGYIYCISQHDHDVVFTPPITAIEITDEIPMPEQGDYFDGTNFIQTKILGDLISWDTLSIVANETDEATLTLTAHEYTITVEGPYGDTFTDTVPADDPDNNYVLTVDEAGTYTITVERFPYNKKEYELNAT